MSDKLTFDPGDIIAKYIAAFSRANPGTKLPAIEYRRGWFVFHQHGVTQRFRRVDVQDFTARLNQRVA